MMRSRIWILGWLGAACLAAALSLPPAGLSAGPPTIGVPDFAADNLPPGVTDFFPGGAAADAATVLLQRTASPQLTVISRKDMAQAQIAVKWRDEDLTNITRLAALAKQAGATYLVIGTVTDLSAAREANTYYLSTARVYAQVFTSAPPRLADAQIGSGSAMASYAANAATAALRQAVEQAVNAARAKMPANP